MENGSQNDTISYLRGDPGSTLFATFSEGRSLYAFWSPFGSLWAPFWLPLAPFWLPLAAFWRHLVSFWHPLAHFWLILTSFWLTFDVFWLTFSVSWSLFSHFYVFSIKMSCELVFLHNFYSIFDFYVVLQTTTVLRSSPAAFLQHSCSIPAAVLQHSCSSPAAVLQHSCSVPAAFLQCSCTSHKTFLQRIAHHHMQSHLPRPGGGTIAAGNRNLSQIDEKTGLRRGCVFGTFCGGLGLPKELCQIPRPSILGAIFAQISKKWHPKKDPKIRPRAEGAR